MTEEKKRKHIVSWKERCSQGSPFQKSLDPKMLTGKVRRVSKRKNEETGKLEGCIVEYDRDFVLAKIDRTIFKSLKLESEEEVLAIVTEAWKKRSKFEDDPYAELYA